MGKDEAKGVSGRGKVKRHYGRWALLALAGMMIPMPAVWWAAVPDNDIRIRVIDKTVPHATYREHTALMWALNHFKAVPVGFERPWQSDRDYVGYTPPREGESAGSGIGVKLAQSHLDTIDMLFIADAYGVYKGDYEKADDLFTHLDYSGRIYGGFSDEEANLVAAFAGDDRRHVVAEFNTLGSPTSGSARETLGSVLGVKWTGWTGRYLNDLNDFTEVPHWAPRLYRRQTGKEWEYDGPGLLFVHEDQRIFVLRMGSEFRRPGPLVRVSDSASPLMEGVGDGVPFLFWFDVVEPRGGTSVLAEFKIEATAEGRRVMESFGLREVWPAVLQGSTGPLRLYMAGDFSDNELGRGPYWLSWWPALVMLGSTGDSVLDGRAFFFRFYVPLIGNILKYAEERI